MNWGPVGTFAPQSANTSLCKVYLQSVFSQDQRRKVFHLTGQDYKSVTQGYEAGDTISYKTSIYPAFVSWKPNIERALARIPILSISLLRFLVHLLLKVTSLQRSHFSYLGTTYKLFSPFSDYVCSEIFCLLMEGFFLIGINALSAPRICLDVSLLVFKILFFN